MNYDKELTFAKELAYEAGTIMRRYFRAEDIGTEWKEDSTPLTAADTAINSLVIKRVQETFPEHGVIGEEDSFEHERDLLWVVDPIDGTGPFSLGIPISTFSIALVDRKDGQPVLAVVYEPHFEHMYSAVRGHGAFLNDTPLKTSSAETLARNYFLIVGGFKNETPTYLTGKCIDVIRDQDGKTMSVPSFIYFGCKIATGEFAGAVAGLKTTWDLVTVALIVQEAGGVVTDLQGNPQRYDGDCRGLVAAANPAIHERLMQAIKAAAP